MIIKYRMTPGLVHSFLAGAVTRPVTDRRCEPPEPGFRRDSLLIWGEVARVGKVYQSGRGVRNAGRCQRYTRLADAARGATERPARASPLVTAGVGRVVVRRRRRAGMMRWVVALGV